VLRWLAIASCRVDTLDYAATTGIHSGPDAVKVLLAGARAVQICSAVYQNGNGVIAQLKEYLSRWMTDHTFDRVEDIVGRMNYGRVTDPLAYERSQFMRHFTDREE
jgi:dihydroorotate dehydrogenase (fumarate)